MIIDYLLLIILVGLHTNGINLLMQMEGRIRFLGNIVFDLNGLN
jgi:hypothetical protein